MILSFDDYELDTDAQELTSRGEAVKADPLLLSLLSLLARNAGKVLTKEQLSTHVWNGRDISDNSINVSMARLRKVLGHKTGEHEYVTTVRRRGYRFVRAVTERKLGEPKASVPAVLSRAPYVGRENVLAVLRDALQRALNGRGNLCMLVGEAGSGKTSAVEKFEREAQAANVPVFWSHCRDAGAPTLWPFAELARGLIEARAVDLASPCASQLLPALEWLLPEFGRCDLRSDEPLTPARKHALFDAITRLLGLLGAGPRVLVLDDLHRADSASLELLEFWLDALSHTHTLLIATLRTAWSAPGSTPSLARIMGHRSCRPLSLRRLNKADVARYLQALVPDSTPAQVHAVFEKSEGNPFFMCELARQVGPAGRALELPAVARGLLEQRIAGLDRDALEVVARAAVIGRRFELSLLQSITQRSASALIESLDRVRARDVIRAVDPTSTLFVFDHELLRQVLQDCLPGSERRRCHVRVAEALERRALAGETIAKIDLAYHWGAALPDGDLRKTVSACLHAARERTALFAYADALRYVRHARQALGLVENASLRLRVGLVVWEALLARVCSDPGAEPLARAALHFARAQGDAPAFAQAALLLDLNPGFPPWPGARQALEEALEILPPNEVGLRAAVLSRLATLAPIAFDRKANSDCLEGALELVSGAQSRLLAYCVRIAELYTHGGPGGEARTAQALRAVEGLFGQKAHRFSLTAVSSQLHRAIRALQAGELARVAGALARARVAAERVDCREWTWHVERCAAVQRVNLGEPDGPEHLHIVHDRAEREQVPGSALFVAFDRAVILADRAASRSSELRSELALGADDPPSVWAMKVRGLQAAGLHDQARSALALVAPANLAELPRDRDYLGTLGALARATVEIGALEYAEVLVEQLAPHADAFAAQLTFLCEGSIAQLSALLSRAMGRHVEARAYLERAITLSEKRGFVAKARECRQLSVAWSRR